MPDYFPLHPFARNGIEDPAVVAEFVKADHIDRVSAVLQSLDQLDQPAKAWVLEDHRITRMDTAQKDRQAGDQHIIPIPVHGIKTAARHLDYLKQHATDTMLKDRVNDLFARLIRRLDTLSLHVLGGPVDLSEAVDRIQ
jgi:hypothetical protein